MNKNISLFLAALILGYLAGCANTIDVSNINGKVEAQENNKDIQNNTTNSDNTVNPLPSTSPLTEREEINILNEKLQNEINLSRRRENYIYEQLKPLYNQLKSYEQKINAQNEILRRYDGALRAHWNSIAKHETNVINLNNRLSKAEQTLKTLQK